MTEDAPSTRKKTVRLLAVDDDEATLRGYQSVLKTVGYEVDTAEDGAVAIAKIERAREREEPFDMLLLDLVMPNLDGLSVLRELRKREIFQLTAIASGRLDSRVCVEAASLGVVDFFAKPSSILKMNDMIERVFAEEREREQLGDSPDLDLIAPRQLLAFACSEMRRGRLKTAAPALDRAVKIAGRESKFWNRLTILRLVAHHLIAISRDGDSGAGETEFASSRFYSAANVLEDLV